jgi:hypothetical protein
MFEFLKEEKFLKCFRDKTHFFFDGVMPKLFDWENVVDEIDRSIKVKSKIRVLPNFGMILHEAENIKGVDFLLKEYSKLDSSIPSSAHCYISFSEKSDTFGRHKDTSDVLFWQALGSTKWIVEDDKIYEYKLCPGDVIYIPSGLYHTVIPLTPRVGISLGLDYGELMRNNI